MDAPALRNATLADLLANGTLGRPDLQAIAPQVNAALAEQQTAVVAAFSRLFPTGLGRRISTTADANGSYFLRTPAGVPGFVRCNPAEAANLVLGRFVPARQPGEQLLGQTVTPATTVGAMVVTDALNAGLDPVAIQEGFLADIDPLRIVLPDHPNGNGVFATVELEAPLPNPNGNEALLAFAATAIFDTMRLQQANIPATTTFTDALRDYFQDAAFAPQLDSLTPAVNTALDQGQPVIGRGRNDIPQANSTGTIVGTVTAPNGAPLAGVQVVATQQGAIVQRAQTDASGFFVLAPVPPGATTVTAMLGSASASRTLTIIAVARFTLALTLAPVNQPPVANAGPAQTVFIQQTVTLDGRASSDPDGGPLTFQWSLVTTPAGSRATLSNPTASQPTFVPDLPGIYTAQLLVNDGAVNSTPGTVTITANLLAPRFAYVANQGDDTVSIYIVDATTGQLRHNGYVAAGTGPSSVTVDPSGRFAYVANQFPDNNISGYTIDASSGALTPLPGSPFAAGTFPTSVMTSGTTQ
jgi:hypothetical protein